MKETTNRLPGIMSREQAGPMAGDVLTARNLLLFRLCMLLLLVFLSFIMATPLLLISTVMDGRCLLYMRAGEQGESASACDYVLIVALGCQLPFTIVIVIYLILKFIKDAGKDNEGGGYWLVAWLVVDVVFSALVLAAVSTSRSGTGVMCTHIASLGYGTCGDPFPFPPRANVLWDRNYYYRLFMSEMGGWLSLSLWVILMVLDALDICLLRREESSQVLKQGPRDLRQAFRPSSINGGSRR